jgi:hypothetical protein
MVLLSSHCCSRVFTHLPVGCGANPLRKYEKKPPRKNRGGREGNEDGKGLHRTRITIGIHGAVGWVLLVEFLPRRTGSKARLLPLYLRLFGLILAA